MTKMIFQCPDYGQGKNRKAIPGLSGEADSGARKKCKREWCTGYVLKSINLFTICLTDFRDCYCEAEHCSKQSWFCQRGPFLSGKKLLGNGSERLHGICKGICRPLAKQVESLPGNFFWAYEVAKQ